MPKFKKGDKVRCLRSTVSRDFIEGNIYTVSIPETKWGSVGLQLDEHLDTDNGWLPEYFELVTPAKIKLVDKIKAKSVARELKTLNRIKAEIEARIKELENA